MPTDEESSFLKIIDDKYKISKRGRSLQVTIPVDVVKMLKFEEGDYVKFVVDEENEMLMIKKKDKLPSATVKIDGATKKAMYFTAKHKTRAEIIEKIGKEGANARLHKLFINGGKERALALIKISTYWQELIDYYKLDINDFINESDS